MAETVSKGKYMGLCNRSACLAPFATWFNTSTRAFYCRYCARAINRGCLHNREARICHDRGKPNDSFVEVDR